VGEEWPQWAYEHVEAEMEEDPEYRRLREVRAQASKQLTEQIQAELGVRGVTKHPCLAISEAGQHT
jgi:hypothetical protein